MAGCPLDSLITTPIDTNDKLTWTEAHVYPGDQQTALQPIQRTSGNGNVAQDFREMLFLMLSKSVMSVIFDKRIMYS